MDSAHRTDSPAARAWAFLPWAALIFALAGWHIALHHADGRGYFFNADMLTVEALYRDVVAGSDLSGWRLSGAPSFFPDMALYFLLRTLIPSVPLTVLVYGLASFAIMLFGWLALWTRFPVGRAGLPHGAMLIAATASVLAAAWQCVDLSSMYLLANSSHWGTLLILPWAFLLTLQLGERLPGVTGRHRSVVAIVLCVLVVLGVSSDKLFIAQVAIPLIAVVLWTAVGGGTRPVIAAGLAAMLGGSIAGGLLLFQTLSRYPVTANYEKWGLPHTDVWACHGRWIVQMWILYPIQAIAVFAFLVVCGYAVCRAVVRRARKRVDPDAEPPEAFAVFYLVGVAANAAMLLFAGNTDGNAVARYSLAMIFVPVWWGWPLLLQAFAPARAWFGDKDAGKRMRIASVAVLAASLPALTDAKALLQCTDYYPRYLRRLDKELARRDLHDGIADYWMAKHLSCLSHHDLRLAQVVHTFQPFFWVNNWASYRMRPEFVVIDMDQPNPAHRIKEALIVKRYGAPADYFICDRLLVLVYNRPSDRAFQSMFSGYDDTPR